MLFETAEPCLKGESKYFSGVGRPGMEVSLELEEEQLFRDQKHFLFGLP